MRRKKYSIGLCAILLSFCLSGCFKKAPPAKTAFDQVIAIINAYNIESTNGYDYLIEQKVGDIIVNSDTITCRVERGSTVKASTDTVQKRLNNFGEEEQFSETTFSSYFNNNQIGFKEQDGVINWVAGTSEEYFVIGIDKLDLSIGSFVSSMVNKSGNVYSLIGTLKTESLGTLFGINTVGMKNISIEIVVNIGTGKLMSLDISYSQSQSSTTISFSPFYDVVTVNFPS